MARKSGKQDKRVHHVTPDIAPYRSMIDGSIISGRKQHREHLRRHGCIEVGNAIPSAPRGIPDTSPRERHELIRAQVNQFTDAQFRKMLRKDVRDRNDNPRRYFDDGR